MDAGFLAPAMRPILQQPEYPDAAALERTLDELRGCRRW
jgi:hypothetical protein